ncbi:MAG: hypothetical protein NT107_01020 [Planctomycetota bacterium]|nr:hypothetical protein [Planctomycetota bacterium]
MRIAMEKIAKKAPALPINTKPGDTSILLEVLIERCLNAVQTEL